MKYLKILLLSIIMVSIVQPHKSNAESNVQVHHWPVPKGEILNWDTIDEIIPRGTKFQVIDVDTGLTFKVQRRAGGSHADVQPLSRNDTNIMKLIYKGKWSWNRNDIVIKVKDKYYAASMNGMPHGYGALRNGFPGHFCIHFKGSTTHKGHNKDLAHHLMIAKAGGRLGHFISNLSPIEVVKAYEIGVNHHESTVLDPLLTSEKLNPLKKFKYMRLDLSGLDEESDVPLLLKVINVDGRVQLNESNRLRRINMTFTLVRESVVNQWKITKVSYE